MLISQYSDSAIIDILQEISSTIHHDICDLRNSESIDCTESISQELQNIVNQFHMNDSQVKQSVYCTVALPNTHTDRNLNIIKYRYLAPLYR